MLTDIDEEGLAAFVQVLDPAGDRVATMRQDARRSEDAQALAEACGQRFGHADYLVRVPASIWISSWKP